MKFLNGGWLVKDGYDVKYAANVYTANIEEGKLTLFCPFGVPIHNAGQTLDGGIMTIEVTSPRPDIITTRLVNFEEDRSHDPEFNLNISNPEVSIEDGEDAWVFTSGRLSLRIAKGESIDFQYLYDGKEIARSGWRAKALVTDPEGQIHVSEQMNLGVGEKIYGLGERFTNFIKNGQTVDIWNEDGGTGTEQAYKNIPFYLSNRNYGLFVNTPGKVSFEIGSEKVSRVQFSVPEQEMSYSVIGGEDLKAILNTYTDLTGKPPLVPDWSYGLWLSTSFTTDYDENTVMQFVDGMAERNIPLSVFHFDCRWMKELEWCNFEWDEDKFPDPEGMLAKLHERGLKVCVWINSYIGQKSPLFKEGAAKGYFIKRTNGQVWQWDKWQAGMAIVDFTNPEAVRWYQDKLKALMAQGVDCFKTDFGERIPVDDVVYYDGSDPQLMHNYYTYLYNKAVYDVIAEVKGEDQAILFARSATVGGQQFPVHWGGDCSSNYPSMAESLRAGLSFGMSGFGYWSHDIAGFEDKPSPDLYKRWTQFGLLSSHSRYHGSNEYKVPWLYGEEAVEVAREFTELKLKLVPYLKRMSEETHATGVPMMRAMVLEFPKDPACEDLDTQYMLGDDLLVAPVFSEDGTARFYVPDAGGDQAGKSWKNLLTGEMYEPGKWYTEQFDYHTLPVLVRPGSDPLAE
ncbi:alpha-xylosidase [Bifidobacterium tsurumiense]|uniref:alpha-D-xyloside xylohydrolase n=1 Tax=Bifidobacterium tsurumiense TaxID=356829 RepID=A0A087EAV0_9BIFI|nr:alpha-xylosidase [Bifidobacterium tsurumiense]KFJ04901.1 alpha-xylosidase [Bifidobacterium tsurumiense]MDY4678638.1 alpha-xylosidase [Bifidobacterium tsurumiense]MSS13407.1 alpha-xylosidase [Bifidobacterium tsurumiense]